MKKKIIFLCTLVFIVLFIASKTNQTTKSYTQTFYGAFDTVHTIMIETSSQDEFDRALQYYKEESTRLHNLYTTFDEIPGIHNLYTVNANAGIQPVQVDPDIISLLKASIHWHNTISNKVNIAMGGVLKLWHDAREQDQLPTMQSLQTANACSDINRIVLDEKANTVYLPDACMSLDVGAIAKGYALEIIANKLQNKGITSAILSAGGNVRVIGTRKVSKPASDLASCSIEYCIGVEPPIYKDSKLDANNPYLFVDYVAKLSVKDTSVVTSGDYQRYFVVNNQVYNHIIDPNTLTSATNFRAVTVITKDSGFADFMSSSLFIMSFEEGKQLVENTKGLEAIWLFQDGTIKTSSNLIEGKNIKVYETK